jgi:hypothetical protein
MSTDLFENRDFVVALVSEAANEVSADVVISIPNYHPLRLLVGARKSLASEVR